MKLQPGIVSLNNVKKQITEIPPFPNELRQAIKDRRLILFLGAGISCSAGAKNWGEISNLVTKHYADLGLLCTEELEQLNTEHYYTRFQFLKNKDQNLYQKKFLELLDIKDLTVINNFRFIIKKLLKFKPISIVTTNVDDLMQKTKIFSDDKYYYKNNCNPQKIREFNIFCLHGNISDNIFVLFEKQRYYGDEKFKFFLNNIMRLIIMRLYLTTINLMKSNSR